MTDVLAVLLVFTPAFVVLGVPLVLLVLLLLMFGLSQAGFAPMDHWRYVGRGSGHLPDAASDRRMFYLSVGLT